MSLVNHLKKQSRLLVPTFFCFMLSLSLSGCFVKPYKFDLKQGNEVTTEMVEQIQPGMSEEQVRYVLGTPLLLDVFHTNRWDYVYYDKPANKPAIRRHLAIYFEHGQVQDMTEELYSTGPIA